MNGRLVLMTAVGVGCVASLANPSSATDWQGLERCSTGSLQDVPGFPDYSGFWLFAGFGYGNSDTSTGGPSPESESASSSSAAAFVGGAAYRWEALFGDLPPREIRVHPEPGLDGFCQFDKRLLLKLIAPATGYRAAVYWGPVVEGSWLQRSTRHKDDLGESIPEKYMGERPTVAVGPVARLDGLVELGLAWRFWKDNGLRAAHDSGFYPDSDRLSEERVLVNPESYVQTPFVIEYSADDGLDLVSVGFVGGVTYLSLERIAFQGDGQADEFGDTFEATAVDHLDKLSLVLGAAGLRLSGHLSETFGASDLDLELLALFGDSAGWSARFMTSSDSPANLGLYFSVLQLDAVGPYVGRDRLDAEIDHEYSEAILGFAWFYR